MYMLYDIITLVVEVTIPFKALKQGHNRIENLQIFMCSHNKCTSIGLNDRFFKIWTQSIWHCLTPISRDMFPEKNKKNKHNINMVRATSKVELQHPILGFVEAQSWCVASALLALGKRS